LLIPDRARRYAVQEDDVTEKRSVTAVLSPLSIPPFPFVVFPFP
jgi:hypothetical protein